MGSLPVVLLLCGLHALAAVLQAQHTGTPAPAVAEPELPPGCREEMYPCTRMYSVYRPIKRCIGGLCIYSLPRVYVINREICTRIVCPDDDHRNAERCRELSGWPKRLQRSTGEKKRCRRNRPGNPKTWANKA